jgi:small subunit ribosomal protein S7
MPRRGNTPRREILPDPVYGNEWAARFINKLMERGKKSLAQRIFYEALEQIGEKTGKPSIEVFETAVKNAMPLLEVKARRVGGSTYQVPVEVRVERRLTLGIRWLIGYARARGERTMVERVAGELLDASNNTGNAVKKKEDTHKMAESNKAFAHFRW